MIRCTAVQSGYTNRFIPYAPPAKPTSPPRVPAVAPEPPPTLAALALPSPTLLALNQQVLHSVHPPKPSHAELMEQFRAQEKEYWERTSKLASRPSEPLLLEELLLLNLKEDSRVPLSLRKLLLATESELPLALNDQVLRYVNYFLGRGQKTLRASLRRAGAYKSMISRILAEEGVPQELIYLVQAESGFQPKARSQKKATGMWQFVAWRGREYGLNQDRHVDERLDPEKATRAAARHLADLYEEFGNWHLAMAAYNCGPGCVERAIERTAYADYWEMVRRRALPRETSNYVPIILALALLGKNFDAFGLEEVIPEAAIAYDTVETNGRVGINLIADVTGSTAAEIRQLNPALLAGATPSGPYALRIPREATGRFHRQIAAVPEENRVSWRRHTVHSGETLPLIAALYKVRPSDISRVNQLASEDVAPGDRVTIPVPYRPDSSRATAAGGATRYRVRAGDTLSAVGRRHGVTVAQLRAWNALKGDTLAAGQLLRISPGATTASRRRQPPARAPRGPVRAAASRAAR